MHLDLRDLRADLLGLLLLLPRQLAALLLLLQGLCALLVC
jgi:hypothetical protein